MKKLLSLFFVFLFAFAYGEVGYLYDSDPVREPDKTNLKTAERARKDTAKTVLAKVDTRVDESGRKHITYYYTDVNKYTFPFTAIYERNGKKLIYIGVQHAAPAAFRMVKNVFDENSPEAVILEINKDSQGQYSRCDLMENYYAKNYAEKKRAKVILSDPSLAETNKTFRNSSKFNTKDYQAYWSMRSVAGYYAQTGVLVPIENFLEMYAQRSLARTSEVMNEKQFLTWYRTNFNKEYKPQENLSSLLFTAEREGLRNITNKIFTEEILISRDPALVDNIYNSLQKYDTVLVIFGAAHWGTMEAVLKEMFGAPKVYTKDNKEIITGLEDCPRWGKPPIFAL